MEKDFIEKSLEANKEKVEGLGMADLSDPNSTVNKAPEKPVVPKEPIVIKPKVDSEGFPELDTLKTYHGDVADSVRSNSLTMLKVAVKEQSRKQYNSPEEEKNKSPLNLWLGIGASFLFVAGIITVGYVWIAKKTPIPTSAPQIRDIILTEKAVAIDIFQDTPREIGREVESEYVPSELENLEKIVFVSNEDGNTRALQIDEVFRSIKANPPGAFERSITPRFMFGAWQAPDRGEPFIILESTPDFAFSGMLEWERTLGHDLEPIIGSEVADRNLVYKDQLILNHDARVLSGPDGKVMFYSIIDQRIVVIVKSEEAFKRILDRIRENKIRQ